MRANVRLSLIVTAVVILSVAWRAGTTRFRTNAIVVDHREKRIIAHPRTDTIIVLAERRVQSARRLRVNDSLIVVQVGPRRLDGFQRDGRQVWTSTHPDTSITITGFNVTRAGTVFAIDAATQQFWRSDFPHAVREQVPLGSVGALEEFVALDERRILGVTRDSLRPLVRFSRDGEVASRTPFPDVALRRTHPLVRQGRLVPNVQDPNWILTFSFIDGYLNVRGSIVEYRSKGVETIVPPRVVIIKTPQGGDFVRLEDRTSATGAAAATNAEVLLLPGDRRTPGTHTLIDRYRRRDGRYVGSYDMGVQVRDIAAIGEEIFVLTPAALVRLTATTLSLALPNRN